MICIRNFSEEYNGSEQLSIDICEGVVQEEGKGIGSAVRCTFSFHFADLSVVNSTISHFYCNVHLFFIHNCSSLRLILAVRTIPGAPF